MLTNWHFSGRSRGLRQRKSRRRSSGGGRFEPKKTRGASESTALEPLNLCNYVCSDANHFLGGCPVLHEFNVIRGTYVLPWELELNRIPFRESGTCADSFRNASRFVRWILGEGRRNRLILRGMATQAADARVQVPRSFAGVLSEFASPGKKYPPARDIDGLEDDVVVVSYEQALRSRSRAGSAEAAGWAVAGPAGPKQAVNEASGRVASAASSFGQPEPEEDRAPGCSSAAISRKSASVTIRLSAVESEQLHARASEAGITVSAYLRSCAFEVEALRAEVKATVAQLRAAKASAEPEPLRAVDTPHGWRRWFRPMRRIGSK